MTDSQTPSPQPVTRFIPPLWAIALMLISVAACSGGTILMIYSIGGGAIPQPAEPTVNILPAPPRPSPTAAPLLDAAAPVNNREQLGRLTLQGPTLMPVYLSPTPDVIAVGRTVLVVNVGESGLNVRSAPGINSELRFTAREGSLLEILAGPENTRDDSFTWWRVRDLFTGDEGWAVQLYMEVQPESTNP